MKRARYIPIFLLVLLPLIAFSETEQKASDSYYKQLKSMLTRHTLKVRPKPSDRDVNLIEVEKGAAGVLFGASMDDVIAIWGKPCGLRISGYLDVWNLSIGACRFGFIDNRLVTISIHSATLKEAHFDNGISFDSSFDEVKAAFGEPVKETDYILQFVTKNDYLIRFQFLADKIDRTKRKLIAVTICHPDSGQ